MKDTVMKDTVMQAPFLKGLFNRHNPYNRQSCPNSFREQ